MAWLLLPRESHLKSPCLRRAMGVDQVEGRYSGGEKVGTPWPRHRRIRGPSGNWKQVEVRHLRPTVSIPVVGAGQSDFRHQSLQMVAGAFLKPAVNCLRQVRAVLGRLCMARDYEQTDRRTDLRCSGSCI